MTTAKNDICILGRVWIFSTYHNLAEAIDIGKQTVKSIQRGGPQHIVSAFFRSVGCYELNIVLEKLDCLNKVGKNIVEFSIGLGLVKFIGKTNVHCFGI